MDGGRWTCCATRAGNDSLRGLTGKGTERDKGYFCIGWRIRECWLVKESRNLEPRFIYISVLLVYFMVGLDLVGNNFAGGTILVSRDRRGRQLDANCDDGKGIASLVLCENQPVVYSSICVPPAPHDDLVCYVLITYINRVSIHLLNLKGNEDRINKKTSKNIVIARRFFMTFPPFLTHPKHSAPPHPGC
jgi:hypothetical protein